MEDLSGSPRPVDAVPGVAGAVIRCALLRYGKREYRLFSAAQMGLVVGGCDICRQRTWRRGSVRFGPFCRRRNWDGSRLRHPLLSFATECAAPVRLDCLNILEVWELRKDALVCETYKYPPQSPRPRNVTLDARHSRM